MAGLFAALIEEPKCKVARLALDDEDRAALEKHISEGNVPLSKICRTLNDAGFQIGSSTLGTHARAECSCG